MAISVASKSSRPVLRRSSNTTRRNCSTSRAISFRISSTVFFHSASASPSIGRQMADRRVGPQKLMGELPEFAELLDFPLRFLDRRRGWQGLRDGLAFGHIGEPEIGAVAWLAGLMTATVRLTTPTGRAGNAAGAKIAELRDTLSNRFTSLF
jgi:hypothetical protein